MKRFEPAGPLPLGTAVLEASAGTGKTHAIAALATRYLAEGRVSADRLAVISFSRIASAELRSRVRDRMRSTADILTHGLAGTLRAPDPTRPTGCCWTASEAEVQARLAQPAPGDRHPRRGQHHDHPPVLPGDAQRAGRARRGGPAGDARRGPQPRSATRWSRTSTSPGTRATRRGRRSTWPRPASWRGRPTNCPTPRWCLRTGSPAGSPSGSSSPAAVREELAARKRRLGVYSFDDQLLRLRDSLRGPAAEARLARLRGRCEVVLVDEFQDTDPVQWEILRTAFADHVPLVLIGDPKQSHLRVPRRRRRGLHRRRPDGVRAVLPRREPPRGRRRGAAR